MLPDFQLVSAVKAGSQENLDLAMERGATLAARDLDGSSLLQVAEKRQQNDMARILIRHGADIHQRIGQNEDSLLHLAASKENFGFAALLIEAGISPNISNGRGVTPLHIATKRGNEYLTRLLLDHKADANVVDLNGDSALHLAARAGNLPLIQLLIRHGALTQINHKHRTPYQEAVKCGQLEAADLVKHLYLLPAATVPSTSSESEPLPLEDVAAETPGRSFATHVRQSPRSQLSR